MKKVTLIAKILKRECKELSALGAVSVACKIMDALEHTDKVEVK